MGGIESKEKTQLNVAVLNFSGIAVSPFQFYTDSLRFQQRKLNKLFQIKLLNYLKQKKKKGESPIDTSPFSKNQDVKNFFEAIKSLDKQHKKDRYSPLYDKNVGINQGKFLNEEQFKQKWQDTWDKRKKSKEYQNQKAQKLRDFDFLCYQVIAEKVYDLSFDKIVNDKSITRYLAFMQKFFGQNFMQPQKKAQAIVNFLSEKNRPIDVLFVQEAGQILYETILKKTKYRIIYGRSWDKKQQQVVENDTAILIYEESFPKRFNAKKSNLIFRSILEDRHLSQERKKSFLLWNKTAVVSIDDFIFVSLHGKKVTKEMLEDIKTIQQKFPKKYLVVGGLFKDLQIQPSDKINKGSKQIVGEAFKEVEYMKAQVLKNFRYFPNNIKQIQEGQAVVKQGQAVPKKFNATLKLKNTTNHTVNKIRTKMQVQPAKAQLQVKQCHSHILYDKRLDLNEKSQEEVIQIGYDSKVRQKKMIPSDQHPFDDYVVFTKLRIPKKKKKNQETKYQRQGQDESSSQQDEDQMQKYIIRDQQYKLMKRERNILNL